MSRWYPFHVNPYGDFYRPSHPNTVAGRRADDEFDTRDEAVKWLRQDFLGCSIQKQLGVAFIAEITSGSISLAPVKVKRIKFVKKVKPASRWKPTWISTRENTIYEEGRVDDNSWKSFETKKEALEYADRYCSRPYWRPGTPKEVK